MKLEKLRIERLPGISTAFEIDDIGSGLNVVLGPNASGKSSLCRAIRALLYDPTVSGRVTLEATFRDGFQAVQRDFLIMAPLRYIYYDSFAH